MSNIIRHKEVGFPANPFNTEEMDHDIIWLIDSQKEPDKIRLSSCAHAEKNYNQAISASRYVMLYQ